MAPDYSVEGSTVSTPIVATFIYAALLLVGGLFGYRAGSSASLAIGGACAVLAAVCGALLLRGLRAGAIAGLVLAVLLLLWGAWSVLGQGKPFMPRGLIAVLSLIEAGVLVTALRPPR